jgi:hypothetical protein
VIGSHCCINNLSLKGLDFAESGVLRTTRVVMSFAVSSGAILCVTTRDLVQSSLSM